MDRADSEGPSQIAHQNAPRFMQLYGHYRDAALESGV